MKCPKCQAKNPESQKFCGDCGTQLGSDIDIPVSQTKTIETPKEELTTGSTFAGRYQVIEELGRGGMGRDYKALDSEVKEKIALKLIKPEIAADKQIIERFRNELKFARKVRHKNVCQMYDLNKTEDAYYITMDYVHGEDLKSLIRKMGLLSPGQAIAEYERGITFDPKKLDRYLVHPRYHYLLAKLYEEKGQTAQAVEQQKAFLDLWKDADADHPEPQDAQNRLARLQNR